MTQDIVSGGTGSGGGLNLEECFNKGFELLKSRFMGYLGMGLLIGVFYLLIMIPSIMAFFMPKDQEGLKIVLNLTGSALSFFASPLIEMGTIRLLIELYEGRPVGVQTLFQDIRMYGWFFLGKALLGVMAGFGFLFFVIPGIFVCILFQFVPYFIVDRQMRTISAFKASFEAAKDNKFMLFLAGLIFSVVTGIGLCVFGIGLIPATMFVHLTLTCIYKQLADKGEAGLIVSNAVTGGAYGGSMRSTFKSDESIQMPEQKLPDMPDAP